MNRRRPPSDGRPRRRSTFAVAIPGVDEAAASAPRARALAASVIRWSSRESPADQVLRAELKKARGLDALTSALTARLVFAYHRWLGWLDPDQPLEGRLARAGELQEQFNREPASFSDAELIERAVPAWTWNFMDVTPAWTRALQAESVVWLRTRPGLGESLSRQLPGTVPGPIPDALRYLGSADLFELPAFHQGDFEIQDLASQLVGHLCAPQPGQTWWDACAGEGGKTIHLSALMRNKGLIWATDRAEWRLARLKRRAARAQVFNYRAATWDGGPSLPTKTVFDGVLVDAPCTGLGTWQRNPQARWTTTPEDVSELAGVQQTLLDRVAGSIKPGGRLVYSVCTLTRTETAAVADAFSHRHPEFTMEPFVWPGLPEPIRAAGQPEVWIWPQTYQSNGMFLAQWRRAGVQ